MRFKFEHNLAYQLEAIRSVVGLFEGAPYIRSEQRILQGVVGNRLEIFPEQIAGNRDRIARENIITDPHPSKAMDFTVEMETGTGKTYVYLRTIIELHRSYGLTKFMIIVPSIPVREGVHKALRDTVEHFRDLYRIAPQFFVYDSKKPAAVRGFAQSNTLQIMVMNAQAFVADDRKIHQETDQNGGTPLIELIADTRPVIVMDEPQEGMGTEKFREKLAEFRPLLTLRYSATHKDVVNLVYRLTPVDAYNRRLVKVLEVLSVVERDAQSSVPIVLSGIKTAAKGNPKAVLVLQARLATGAFKEKSVIVKVGDDLEAKTKNPAYAGWKISGIRRDIADRLGRVAFTNGVELVEGMRTGHDRETIFREQIRRTIEQHFLKKDRLAPKGIKVLSLFFIDRVANYMVKDGLIKKLFETSYQEEYHKRYGTAPAAVDAVHNGYFAQTSNGEWTDNEASMAKNAEAYDLILKDKERLLDPKEPVEFVFSHSALGVGWDNPNVFNICTLNERESATRKRQEIGRGLRLSVNANLERVHDPDDVEERDRVNVLTVVPNASYEQFVETYQKETREDLGADVTPPVPRRTGGIKRIARKESVFGSDAFDELWKRIAKKTRYDLALDEKALIDGCAKILTAIRVPEHRVVAQLDRITHLTASKEGIKVGRGETYTGEEVRVSAAAPEIDLAGRLAKETRLAYGTVFAALIKADCGQEVMKNPMAWLSDAAHALRKFVNREMVNVIRYAPTGDAYDAALFDKVIETYADTVTVRNGLYEAVPCDSGVEKSFAADVGDEARVRFLLKLPPWYRIDTPVGPYHPDWALVVERQALGGGDKERFRFVVETKGTPDIEDLAEDERLKILCAQAHFEAIGFKWYVAPITDKAHLARATRELTETDIL